MIKNLIRWTEKFAEHKHSEIFLSVVSFTESSIFPIPPDFLIIAILSHHIKKSWIKIASNTTLSSVLGGILGYTIGHFFYQYLGLPLVHFYGVENEIASIGEKLRENAFWFLILLSFTPIPYKVATISSGIFNVSFPVFLIASIIGRAKRFFLVAYLSHRFGVRAKQKILETDEKLIWFSLLAIIVLIYLLFIK